MVVCVAEFQRRIPVWERETDDGPIDFDVAGIVDSVPVDFKIIEVRIHLSGVGVAGNLTITVDSDVGAEYDINLVTQDMSLVQDFIWRPAPRALFQAGEVVNIAWANANSLTYGLEVIWAHVRDGG